MYCQHFNLEKKPFQLSSDNGFLWLGRTHAQALDALKNGIEGDSTLLVLTGDVGTGKTTLLHEIIHTLPRETACAHITDPSMELHHLFAILAEDLGFKDLNPSDKFTPRLTAFLDTLASENRKALIIIDEAHLIPERFLSVLLSWSGLKMGQMLTIILAGQLEFHQVMEKRLGREWKTRVDVHAMLSPLDERETKTYIDRRLALAGARRKIFIVAAVRHIHIFSKGIPRQINMACDQAMIAAYAKDMKIIDVPTLKEALGLLDIPVQHPAPEKENRARAAPSAKILAGFLIMALAGFAAYHFYLWPGSLPQKPRTSPLPAVASQAEPVQETPEAAPAETAQQPPGLPIPLSASSEEKAAPEAPPPSEVQQAPPVPPDISQEEAPLEFYSPPEEDEVPPMGDDRWESPRQDMEHFINEVFMIDGTARLTPEPPASPEPADLDHQLDHPTGRTETAKPPEAPSPREGKPVVTRIQEPDPQAVIDWLLEKKGAR